MGQCETITMKTIDDKLSEVLEHEYLVGSTDASHHTIYHYICDEGKGDIFIPTYNKEGEPFAWSFVLRDGENVSTVEETPDWFRNRFYIGKAMWGKAVGNALPPVIACDVIHTFENHFHEFESTGKLKKYVLQRMKELMEQQQRDWFAEDLKKFFEDNGENAPLFLVVTEKEGETVYQRADSFDPEQVNLQPISPAIVEAINKKLMQRNRSYIQKRGVMWL